MCISRERVGRFFISLHQNHSFIEQQLLNLPVLSPKLELYMQTKKSCIMTRFALVYFLTVSRLSSVIKLSYLPYLLISLSLKKIWQFYCRNPAIGKIKKNIWRWRELFTIYLAAKGLNNLYEKIMNGATYILPALIKDSRLK